MFNGPPCSTRVCPMPWEAEMGGTWEDNAPHDDYSEKQWARLDKLRKRVEKKYPDLYEWILLHIELTHGR